MKTGKIFKSLFLMGILAVASPTVSKAIANHSPVTVAHREEQANKLKARLEEIKAMDTKNLSREEKKALRGEVKAIKKELAAISGGVYLSVGAIILIALLLILLL